MKRIMIDLVNIEKPMLDKYIEELDEMAERCIKSVELGYDFSLSIKADKEKPGFINVDYIPSDTKMEGDLWEEKKGKEVADLLTLIIRLRKMRGDYSGAMFQNLEE